MQESVLSFHHLRSRNWSEVIRLIGSHLCLNTEPSCYHWFLLLVQSVKQQFLLTPPHFWGVLLPPELFLSIVQLRVGFSILFTLEDYNLALLSASPTLCIPDFDCLFISNAFFGLLCLCGSSGKRLCAGHISFLELLPFILILSGWPLLDTPGVWQSVSLPLTWSAIKW